MMFRIRNGDGGTKPEGGDEPKKTGRGRAPKGSRGFSLPVVLILTAAASYGASRLEVSAHYVSRRDREEELLFRGAAYARAIKSFYAAETDPAKRRLPGNLDELLKDPRAQHRRHIRAVYKDPITGQDFKVLKRPEGIAGVSSPSNAAPLQRVDFAEDLGLTEGAKSYSEWIFEAKIETKKTPVRGPGGLTPGVPFRPPGGVQVKPPGGAGR